MSCAVAPTTARSSPTTRSRSSSPSRIHRICRVRLEPDLTQRRHMRRAAAVLISGLVLAMVVTVSAQLPGGSDAGKKMKNPVAPSKESVEAGKALFQKNCRFCHGADAKGDGPMAPKDTHPSNLTDDKWDRGSTDGEIFLVIANGAGPKDRKSVV